MNPETSEQKQSKQEKPQSERPRISVEGDRLRQLKLSWIVLVFACVFFAAASVGTALILQINNNDNTQKILKAIAEVKDQSEKRALVMDRVEATLNRSNVALSDLGRTMTDQRQALIDAQKILDEVKVTLDEINSNVSAELSAVTQQQRTTTVRVVAAAQSAEEASKRTNVTVKKALPPAKPLWQKLFGSGTQATPAPTPKKRKK